MPEIEDDEQEPGHVLGAEHGDLDEDACSRIVEAARAVAASSGDGSAPGNAEELQAALRDASPDERSSAVKELVDDSAAYEAVHEALRDMGIEPT